MILHKWNEWTTNYNLPIAVVADQSSLHWLILLKRQWFTKASWQNHQLLWIKQFNAINIRHFPQHTTLNLKHAIWLVESMTQQSSYKVHLNTISNGELSDPLCDSVNIDLTLVRLHFLQLISIVYNKREPSLPKDWTSHQKS